MKNGSRKPPLPLRMRSGATSVKKADLHLRIETLFDTLCTKAPVVRHRENCGSEMVNRVVVFFLADSKRRWTSRCLFAQSAIQSNT
jgi:hypothetical protein